MKHVTLNVRAWHRWLRRPIKGLMQLTRYKEYVLFVTVTTLLGQSSAGERSTCAY
jgi:hypothetical protein